MKLYCNNFFRHARPYAVVCFPEENNSLSVVPSKWLSSQDNTDLYKCRWPVAGNVKKASKKQLAPTEDWPSFKAKVIHFSRKLLSLDCILGLVLILIILIK